MDVNKVSINKSTHFSDICIPQWSLRLFKTSKPLPVHTTEQIGEWTHRPDHLEFQHSVAVSGHFTADIILLFKTNAQQTHDTS
jgi:hypothetical protein